MRLLKKINDDLKEYRNKDAINNKIKRLTKAIEILESEYKELNKKYIELLEDKSKAFDMYIDYKNKYETVYNDRKELKKALALEKEKNSK